RAGMRQWNIVQGDGFQLPIRGTWDLLYSFRFIRHFDETERSKLYQEVRRLLRPGGWFLFDVVNERVSAPLRRQNPAEYQHFDALLRPEDVLNELTAAGFGTVRLEGVQHRYH